MENTQCSYAFWRRRMLAGWSKASGGPPAGLGALTCYAGAVAHRCGGISSLPPPNTTFTKL